VPDWKALVELDPSKNLLRVFNATGAPGRQGYPLTALHAVLPQSATHIWFSAKDYDLDYPVIGLLDTETLRISYWILAGPVQHGSVRDLVLDAAGNVWFACMANAAQGEQVAFLGRLNPLTRSTRYWLTSGVHEMWPDRRVGCWRLGAKNRLAATRIWLAERDCLSSNVYEFDTGSLAVSSVPFGSTNLSEGRFSVAVNQNNKANICYRDFVREYSGAASCRWPSTVATASANARRESFDAQMASFEVIPHPTKINSRNVDTNELVLSSCVRELTPDNPSICDMVERGADNSLWLGRDGGYEIGLYKP